MDRDPETIVRRHRENSPERQIFEAKICPAGEFAVEVLRARELCSGIVERVNPRTLMSLGPFDKLPSETKGQISRWLNGLYLESIPIESIKADIEVAINAFSAKLQAFAETWQHQTPPTSQSVGQAFIELQAVARDLYAAIGRIPDGTVLP